MRWVHRHRCVEGAGSSGPFVRLWTVRLLGDTVTCPHPLPKVCCAAPPIETNLEVRDQLASTAARLPAPDGLSLAKVLALRPEDATDNRMPLLIWWAIETQCASHPEAVLQLFEDPGFWKSPLVRTQLLDRTARRFASAESRRDLQVCATL